MTERPLLSTGDLSVFRFTLGPYQTHAYGIVCRNTGESTLIDAPRGVSEVLKTLRPEMILITHGHPDHTGGLLEEGLSAVPVLCHEADRELLPVSPDAFLRDGMQLNVGRLSFRVYHVPGHTPGSVAFHLGNFLFSGDGLCPGGPGHTDRPEDLRTLMKSLEEKIFPLPGTTLVLPGHGPPTNVGTERDAAHRFMARGISDHLFGDVTWEG